MIRLSSSSVMAVYEDGTRRSFEFDELQSRLYRSCLACGISDGNLAEDMTLSVEYVLKKISAGGRVFAVSEVNSFVVRMLEEAGYPEIAESFTCQNSIRKLDVKPDSGHISGIVSAHLAVEGEELELIVRKLVSSFSMLGIAQASPSLILELARHYRGNSSELNTVSIGVAGDKSRSPWCIRKDEIFDSLSSETMKLVAAQVISAGNVSRLFPSQKIGFDLAALAARYELGENITELAILPCFRDCAAGINEIASVSQGLYQNHLAACGCGSSDARLPVFLMFSGIPVFSERHLGMKWPASHACVREMAGLLSGMLDTGISIRDLPS